MSINANNAALNEILETINKLPEAGSGKTEIETTIDITKNGETVVTPDDETTTLSKVTVNVDVPIKDEQSKTIDITENGTTEVTPDEGMVLSKVTVNVEIENSGGTNVNGIFFTEFDSIYGLPQTIDMRNMGYDYDKSKTRGSLHYLFTNYSTSTGNGFYTELKTVYLPDWIVSIGISMFNCCRSLENIYGDFSNVTIIDGAAFGSCKSLKTIPYMPKLQKIEGNAFNGCTALTEIKLPDTITSLKSNAFNGCTALTDIYVGFAEGAVVNAPWGATNATIHYNTIYDENGNPIDCSCEPETEGCPNAEN